MRDDLLGLELERALGVLKAEGILARVTETRAPKREAETRGVLRVVYASADGERLTVARFLDPIAENARENG